MEFGCAAMLLSLVAGVSSAQERRHPGYFMGINDIKSSGHEWVAASSVLTSDGLVRSTGVHDWMRQGLEWQLQNSRADHGLEDGEIPSTDQWCPLPEPVSASYVAVEQDGRFISALLLADVAVTATLKKAVYGFFSFGEPGVLFSLSDVVPLHGRSAVPDHILVPVERMVIRGRVFCTQDSLDSIRINPTSGSQVVILGDLGDHGTVRIGNWLNRIGHLALVDDRETLSWSSIPKFTKPPSNLSELHGRIDDAVRGGLFDVTSHLVHQEHGSPDRVDFVERLGHYESSGCRVLDVAGTYHGEWQPTRFNCPK